MKDVKLVKCERCGKTWDIVSPCAMCYSLGDAYKELNFLKPVKEISYEEFVERWSGSVRDVTKS